MWGYFHRMKRYSRPVPMGWLSVHGAEIASHGPPALPTGHDESSRASRTSFRALPRFQHVLEQPPKRTGPYSSGVRSPGVEPTTLSLTGSQGRVSTNTIQLLQGSNALEGVNSPHLGFPGAFQRPNGTRAPGQVFSPGTHFRSSLEESNTRPRG